MPLTIHESRFGRTSDPDAKAKRPIPERMLSAISMDTGHPSEELNTSWRPTLLGLVDSLLPSDTIHSYTPEERRRARVIATTVGTFVPLALLTALVNTLTTGPDLSTIATLIGVVTILGCIVSLHRGTPTALVGVRLIFAYLFSFVVFATMTGGVTGAAAAGLPIIPILAITLTTPRAAAFSLYATCLTIANLTGASVLGLIPTEASTTILVQIGHGVGIIGATLSAFTISQVVLTARRLADTDVKDINASLALEVTEHRKTRENLRETHQELLAAAKRAGAAEVTTGVLHNVGNGLNSVNVGAALLDERLHNLRLERVGRLANRLEETPDIDERLAKYALGLYSALEEERDAVVTELRQLRRAVDHVTATVATQQRWAQNAGVTQLIELPELISEVLSMTGTGAHYDIEVTTDLQEMPSLIVDRHRLVQILANLISNAKDAVRQNTDTLRRVRIRAKLDSTDILQVSITDTGHGIESHNLDRIFQHGFSTKADGHGFGLHASSLAAQELDGTLKAHSAGRGQGATFVLTLPVHVATQF